LVCTTSGIFSLFLRPVRLISSQITHYWQIFLLRNFPQGQNKGNSRIYIVFCKRAAFHR
jgi:hypothetical protein